MTARAAPRATKNDEGDTPASLRRGALVVAIVLAVTALATEPATAVRNQDDRARVWNDVDALARGREALGFPAQGVDDLLADSDALEQLAETGFLLTASEAQQLADRRQLAVDLAGVIERAAASDGFGGLRLEHIGSGTIHFYVTSTADREAIKAGVPSAVASRARVHVVERSLKELAEAIDHLWGVARMARLDAGIVSIGIGVAENGLILELADDLDRGAFERLELALANASAVQLRVVPAARVVEANCASREDCDYPMRGGIAVRQGSSAGPACTMGFHVRSGSDEQFLTSGHCGYSGSNTWYHAGYGSVGSELASIYVGGYDAMTVQMTDSQASNKVYWNTSSTKPILFSYSNGLLYNGMPICMSGAMSGNLCGTISASYTTWTGASCSCTQVGAKATFLPSGGDSGAPVYNGTWAAGLVSTTQGHFVRIADALSYLSVTLVNS